jgi:hypothetical protein
MIRAEELLRNMHTFNNMKDLKVFDEDTPLDPYLDCEALLKILERLLKLCLRNMHMFTIFYCSILLLIYDDDKTFILNYFLTSNWIDSCGHTNPKAAPLTLPYAVMLGVFHASPMNFLPSLSLKPHQSSAVHEFTSASAPLPLPKNQVL